MNRPWSRFARVSRDVSHCIVSANPESVRIAVFLPRDHESGRILEDSLKRATLPEYEGRIDQALAAAASEIDGLRQIPVS